MRETVIDRKRTGAQVDGRNPALRQSLEFALLKDSILVRILPDAETLPLRIVEVDQAVMVGIECGETSVLPSAKN